VKDGADDGQTEARFGRVQGKSGLEALRGKLTTAQLATKHGEHQMMIREWKRQAVDGLASIVSGKPEEKEGLREGDLEKL
jgi:transposase